MSRLARLGAFILTALALLCAGVFVIGSKTYLFHSTYQLRAQFSNVAGLSIGADVQVGGVPSGTVRSITLPHKPGELVTIVMDVDTQTHEIIKQDSESSIETEGLLGNQFVAISFGSSGQAEVHDGDLIRSHPPLMLADLLLKADGILFSSQQVIQNSSDATAHLNSISGKIDSGQGTVGALINDREMYGKLQQATVSLQGAMDEARKGVTGFRENMDALKHNILLRGFFSRRGYDSEDDLTEFEIKELPIMQLDQAYSFLPQSLFGEVDSVKLRNQKSLNACGEYLAKTSFGVAVIVVSSGMQGDAAKAKILAEVRALAIREYLVQHFGFDDGQLKTIWLGKQPASNLEADMGTIEVRVYGPEKK